MNELIKPPKPTCPPPTPTEAAILDLARTQPVIHRHEIEARVETCYEAALEKVIKDGNVEVLMDGTLKSLICRVKEQSK